MSETRRGNIEAPRPESLTPAEAELWAHVMAAQRAKGMSTAEAVEGANGVIEAYRKWRADRAAGKPEGPLFE